MALKSCSYCGHTISTLALACPGCGAPGEAAGRPRAAAASPPSLPGEVLGTLPRAAAPDSGPERGAGTSRSLLVIGALGMALLGAIVDAAIHRSSSAEPAASLAPSDGQATDTAELRQQIVAGLQGRTPEAAIETVRAYQEGARELRAVTEMRLALAQVTTKEEMWYAERAEYASDLESLRVVARPGVHLTLTAGPTSWSASAVHDNLAGVTCRTGVGGGEEHPGQITCPGADTLHGRLP